jgi:hypothetical protein
MVCVGIPNWLLRVVSVEALPQLDQQLGAIKIFQPQRQRLRRRARR